MLVDSNLTHFSGEGIYLYPAWGAPSPYLVRKADATSLAFCHPASGAELWRQTLIPTFAGKLEKVVAGHDIAGIKQLHQQLTPVAMQPAS